MRFIVMVFYKLKLMFHDRLFFSVMVIVPIFITLATGYALRHEKYDSIPIAFVDLDKSQYSMLLIQRVSVAEGLNVISADAGRAGAMMRNGQIEAAFTIKAGFMDAIKSGDIEGIIDSAVSPSSFSAGYVHEVVAGVAMRLIADHTAARIVDEDYRKLGKTSDADPGVTSASDEALMAEVAGYTDSLWKQGPLMTIQYVELNGTLATQASAQAAGGKTVPAAAAASTGLIVVFIMFYMLFSSGWLIDERMNGTLKRLIAGPGALSGSFVGNMGALALSGIFQITLFSVAIRLGFGVQLFPGPLSYLIFGLYLLSVISISMFLSAMLRTSSQLQSAAPVIALMSGFAGGCFWNFAEMPKGISEIALATPQGWVMKAINALILNSSDAAAVILPCIILAMISLILMPLSYIIIKARVTG